MDRATCMLSVETYLTNVRYDFDIIRKNKTTTTQHQYLIDSIGKYFIKRRLTARLDLDTYSTCINAFIMVDSDGLLITSVCLFINWALSHQEVCVMP